jgi:hypothetical protein
VFCYTICNINGRITYRNFVTSVFLPIRLRYYKKEFNWFLITKTVYKFGFWPAGYNATAYNYDVVLKWPLSLSCSEILLEFRLNFLFACSKLRILDCLIVQKENLISLLQFNSAQLNFSHHPVIFSSHSFLKYKETRISSMYKTLRQLPFSWAAVPNVWSALCFIGRKVNFGSCVLRRSGYFYVSACVRSLCVCVCVCGTDFNCHLRSTVICSFYLPQSVSALTQQSIERTAL